MGSPATVYPASPASAATLLALPRESFLLDVRSPEVFAAGHLRGAGHIEPQEFMPRRAELPPRDAHVIVLEDSPARARAAAEQLGAIGYANVQWLETSLALLPSGHDDRGPASRLWRPSPFLERILPLLPRGRVLDVAAGSGREAVFLAMQGYDVECWDRAPEALERAHALATRHSVTIRSRVVDLEYREVPDPGEFEVVMVFRFLHRPLFPWLERAVAPGGALVYETYRAGQEVHGRPTHPRFLLTPGELSSAFPPLSVVLHEEPDIPGGPVMSHLLARRPLIPV